MVLFSPNAIPTGKGEAYEYYNSSTMNVCVTFPTYINSNGVWGYLQNGKNNPLEATLPLLEIQLLAVFSISQALNSVLKQFGIPILVSQSLAGIILGPAVLGLNGEYSRIILSYRSQEILDTLSGFGFILSLFLLGVRMDISMVLRTGKKTLYAGVLNLLLPLLFGALALEGVSRFWDLNSENKRTLLIVSLTYSLICFPVIATLLIDLKILNSELGRLGLSSTLVCEAVSIFLAFLTVLAKTAYHKAIEAALMEVTAIVVYVIAIILIIRPVMCWVVKQTHEGRPVKNFYIHCIILGAMASSLLSFRFGVFIIFGPLFLGLAVPNEPPLGSSLVAKLDPIVHGLIFPVFVTSCMMRANPSDLTLFDDSLIKSTVAMIAVITVAKYFASVLPLLVCNVPKKDAATFGLILSCKGTIEMAIYAYCRDKEIISNEMFVFLVFVILMTKTIVTILIKRLYDPSRIYAGYQKRNIMHSNPNSELHILACIYKPTDIPSIINFLELSGPTRENPLAVYVLHLIKLYGQATPIFISHQKQRKTAFNNKSYSENVILSFRQFDEGNEGVAYVHTFTAISPPKFMHEDICLLALDKLASIIVLPFHRKWSIDGFTESEDGNIRELNCSVLKRAPCSVGILVDRGHLGPIFSRKKKSKKPIFSVAMIFFGGSDDREALTLAKRMIQDRRIRLTVLRFISRGDEIGTDWEKINDSEVLMDVKPDNIWNLQVEYIEKIVEDGTQTASTIRYMADKYDLIIVGRRHNKENQLISGLDKWNEFIELGDIGDFLVSADLPRRYSVLVVQQQQMI